MQLLPRPAALPGLSHQAEPAAWYRGRLLLGLRCEELSTETMPIEGKTRLGAGTAPFWVWAAGAEKGK